MARGHGAIAQPSSTLGFVGLVGILLIVVEGLQSVADTALTGLSTGSIYALGAVGLTLVYGILKLVNFAHGDFLTFGAYMAFLVNVTWGAARARHPLRRCSPPRCSASCLEKVMWAPMRARGAGMLQLLLMSIGLAFVIRYAIQFIWGTELRQLDVNVTATVEFLGLSIGRIVLIVIIVGFIVLIATGLMLRFTRSASGCARSRTTSSSPRPRGSTPRSVILCTWIFAGGFAGLAGVLLGATSSSSRSWGSSCCCRSSPRWSSAGSVTPSARSRRGSCSAS